MSILSLSKHNNSESFILRQQNQIAVSVWIVSWNQVFAMFCHLDIADQCKT